MRISLPPKRQYVLHVHRNEICIVCKKKTNKAKELVIVFLSCYLNVIQIIYLVNEMDFSFQIKNVTVSIDRTVGLLSIRQKKTHVVRLKC
jgi:hypothetical protein